MDHIWKAPLEIALFVDKYHCIINPSTDVEYLYGQLGFFLLKMANFAAF